MSELNRRREDQNFDYSVLSYQSMLARPLESMVEIQLPGDVDHTPVRPFKFEVVDGSPRLAVVDRSLSVQAIPTVFLPGLITFDPVDLGKAEGTILFAFQYLQLFEGIERQLRVVEVSGDGGSVGYGVHKYNRGMDLGGKVLTAPEKEGYYLVGKQIATVGLDFENVDFIDMGEKHFSFNRIHNLLGDTTDPAHVAEQGLY